MKRISLLILAIVSAPTVLKAQLSVPTRPNMSGKAVVWGRSLEGQTDIPASANTGICSVAGHYGLTVALKTDGTIISWGSNAAIPTTIGAYPFSTIVNAVKIKVFQGALGILSSEGKLATMSDSYGGGMLTLPNVVDFDMGLGFRIVLKNNRSVEVYGSSLYTPNVLTIPNEALTNIIKVAAGTSHAGVIDINGKVILWGPDWPTASIKSIPTDAQSNITSLAIGWGHALALKNNGYVIAWGDNGWGQCNIPEDVQGKTIGIVADEAHSAALLSDGRVVVWGYGDYGQKNVPEGKRFVSISGVGQAVYAVEASYWLLTTSINNPLMGTVSLGGYKEDKSVQTIQASPNPGYIFLAWSGDILGTSNPISVVMNINKVVTANFSQDLADNDADGLTNYQEIITHGTNPNQKDTNSDGVEDGQAVSMGYNPTLNFSALIAHPPTGLYTASQMQAMAFGDLVLTKNANGSFTLNYDIEQSTDLQNWSIYAPQSLPLTNLPPDKAFVRIKAKQVDNPISASAGTGSSGTSSNPVNAGGAGDGGTTGTGGGSGHD